ncbi:outer membrane beta-barrel protein [Flavobacteriaceae bacterium]|jgi:hypothetical protein|nr:outer membrane beta-barrel protein [Flavobacteriaceae bacterium]
MSDKKHIDRLFQEKLKDFEQAPDDAVWRNIKSKIPLDDKKDRKLIPFWFRLTAVAAVLLIFLGLGGYIFNKSSNVPNKQVSVKLNNNGVNDAIQNTEKIILQDTNLLKKSSKNEVSKLTTTQYDNKQQVSAIKKTLSSEKNNTIEKQLYRDPSALALQKSSVSPDNNNGIKDKLSSSTEPNSVIKNKSNAGDIKMKELSSGSSIQVVSENNNSDFINDSLDTILKADNPLIALNEVTDEAIAESTLEEEASEDKKKKKEILNRWKIAPNIAPVYFNTLGTGSSIHEQFNKNAKTGDVNISYGVRGSYALNTRLSIRSGISRVTLGYSTDDVFVLNNVTATPADDRFLLRNVALKEESKDISFISVEEFNFAQIPSVISNQIIGSIDQKLGFIEIPIELEYELSREKLGLRVLGGFSALFLNENEVYSSLDGETLLIGSATNINKTSFTANFGVGMDFRLSEKIKLNLEPTFKYQINTFNNTSGEFKPYFIGIYSGFSYKF